VSYCLHTKGIPVIIFEKAIRRIIVLANCLRSFKTPYLIGKATFLCGETFMYKCENDIHVA